MMPLPQQPEMMDPAAMGQQQQMQAPPDPDMQPEEGSEQEAFLDFALTQRNLATTLKKRKGTDENTPLLDEIGAKLLQGIQDDDASREGWCKQNEEAIKLALLIRENKSWPWDKASNVKYPLVATAAMQFSARAYPALVPADGRLVKTKLSKTKVSEAVYDAAARISNHMSYQILERMPNWEEDMDKLLMTMAISGICFKKTWYDSALRCNRSHLVYPEDLIVNYHAKSLELAYRKTEILRYTKNEVEEKIRNDEEFLDVELGEPQRDPDENKSPATGNTPPPIDGSTPYIFYQCHTFWDLDDDGYEEPYIITLEKFSGKVVRIVARLFSDGYKVDPETKKVLRIQPIEYFTPFPFIPNPDGSIYALGFGMLLGPLNESVNTLINQLVDAGTLNNLQAGFLGKGLRLKMGETTLKPGEWKVVNATGEDLSKSIFPMPTKEPSGVLLNLLQLLITSGNQLASIAEIFVGKMPGQNTPATTTQETIQQGMAVFTAIYKRVYRSLAQEFKKIFYLNRICDEAMEEEAELSGIDISQSDYRLPDWLFVPGADPIGDSMTVKMNKYAQVGNLLQLGTINVQEYTRRMLSGLEIPNPEQLQQQPPPPPPDPKQETEKLKQQTMQQKAALDEKKTFSELQAKEALAAMELRMQDAKRMHEEQMAQLKLTNAANEAKMDRMLQMMDMHFGAQERQAKVAHTVAEGNVKLQQARAQGQQKLQMNEQSHRQKQQQAKATEGKKKQRKGA